MASPVAGAAAAAAAGAASPSREGAASASPSRELKSPTILKFFAEFNKPEVEKKAAFVKRMNNIYDGMPRLTRIVAEPIKRDEPAAPIVAEPIKKDEPVTPEEEQPKVRELTDAPMFGPTDSPKGSLPPLSLDPADNIFFPIKE